MLVQARLSASPPRPPSRRLTSSPGFSSLPPLVEAPRKAWARAVPFSTRRWSLPERGKPDTNHRTSGAFRWRARSPSFPTCVRSTPSSSRRNPRSTAGSFRSLATCRWIGNGDALLLLGPPGVGKTHLAVALGREAIQHGYSTLFTSATALVTCAHQGAPHRSARVAADPLHEVEAPDRRRTRLPAAGSERRAPVLSTRIASLRERVDADHQQPCGERVGNRVR
jgi:hypothetical protein